MLDLAAEQIELAVPEDLRPRVARQLGIPLPWDEAVDRLGPAKLDGMSGFAARCCRVYRSARPRPLGNRCAFEPSRSRFAELSFRQHGFRRGLRLTIDRLGRCRAGAGGLDVPPGMSLGTMQEGEAG